MTAGDIDIDEAVREMIAKSRCAVSGEYDLRMVVNEPDAAADNDKAFRTWFGEPQRYPLLLPAGRLFVNEEVADPPKTSTAVIGGGGGGYILPEHAQGPDGPGGALTQIIRLRNDSDKEDDGSAVWRMRGQGSLYANIMWQGRRKVERFDAGQGARTHRGVVIEGRAGVGANPPTGNHLFLNCQWVDCAVAIDCPQNDPQEEHADSCSFIHCGAFGFDTFFRSENQQAIGHSFSNVNLVPYKSTHATAFDLRRGGDLSAVKIHANGPKFTLLKLRDYSPNTNRFEIGFRYDTPDPAPGSLTLLDLREAHDAPFCVRLSGLIAGRPGVHYDPAELFRFAPGATEQESDVRCDVVNLPHPWARRFR